ncbi:phage tail-collar fiber domain-containing protein [Pseudoalteromonas rhizosphaerae]|uniref:Phage tail protein n=1 Tax=Pseudoalteromonas rhizosphaerae TaxID=2518973 RepID=A0ABW8KS91_9GAMM
MASIITIAGEKLFAAKAQANEQLDIDTFIFANVPLQDATDPINREEGLPTDHVVHQQIVQQVGRINDNVVVYSTVLDSITGPFEFNWVGLYSSINDTLVAINHVPTTPKTATAAGVAGNTLNRNFGIEYSGIADLTGIDVAPETWQLDFTARLKGMDKLTQQLTKDMVGKDSFIDDGFKVIPRSTANTFEMIPGAGYVNGFRVERDTVWYINMTPEQYPLYVYADAYFEGDASSTWAPRVITYLSNDPDKQDFVDGSGVQHYMAPLAIIKGDGDVEDLRVSFTLQQDSYTRGFNTVAEAQNDKFLKMGQKISIKERDNAEFYIVKSSATNGISVIDHAINDIQFEIIETTTMTLENFGATTNDTGDNSQIWAIINASSIISEIKTKRGAIYRNTNDVIITKDFSINGKGTINSVGCKFTLSGSLIELGRIVNNSRIGKSEITVSDATNIKAGDVLVFQNQLTSSFSIHRDYYYDGEFAVVLDVNGNNVTLESGILTTYLGYETDKVFLLNHITCEIGEVSFYGTGVYSLECKFNYGSVINPKSVLSSGAGSSAALVFNKSFQCDVNPKLIKKSYESGGTDYGVLYSNSQSIRLIGGNIFGGRHAVAHGGDDSDGAVPCRDIVTKNAVLKNDVRSNTHTADIHGNSENCYFVDCKIYGWTGIGGKDCGVRGGEVIPTDGQIYRNFQWVEVVGGRIEFTGIKTSLAPNSSAMLYGPTSATTLQKVSGDVEYVIENIDLFIPDSSAASGLGVLGNYADGSKVSWDAKVNNIKVRGYLGAIKRITTLDSNNDGEFFVPPRSLKSHILDNIDMDVSSIDFWVVNGGQMIAPGTRVTMPKIERAANVSIESGNNVSTEALSITFPSYIRKPNVLTMCDGQSSSAGVYVNAQCTESTVTSASVYLSTMSPTDVVSAKVDQRISVRVGFDNFEWV